VSDADRRKWNERYAQGAFAARTHPNELLENWLPNLPVGRALDIACGAGRNSLFLAAAGFEVDALDISSEGLSRAAATARAQGLEINWLERDLESGLPDGGTYDVIVMFRYVNMPLLHNLKDRLRPGGYLLVEEHLVTEADVIGPRGSRFRVEPGELAAAAADLQICYCDEAVVTDPDGRRVALARLVARRA
jgi:2-polyprenyl-3-methyl-5-hydroxy-6-metoxy-1,4-benzoquinol methylase